MKRKLFISAGLSFLISSLGFAVTIQQICGQVSTDQYRTYQQAIENMGLGLYGGDSYNQGFRNRDGYSGGGTLGNRETSLYLNDNFTQMGLSVTTQGSYKNVVAEMTGSQTPEKIYIICAHFDSTGPCEKPGGDDNASGTAGILEAARILSKFDFASTIRFVGFNAEEDGLLGSFDYVNNAVIENGETVAGVINLDMILSPLWDNDPTQPDADLLTSDNELCLNWTGIFMTAAQTYVPSLNIDPLSPSLYSYYASDQGPFIGAGFPAIGIFENTPDEIWSGSNPYYHSSQDSSDSLAGPAYDYLFASDIVKASIAVIAQEARIIPEPAALLLLGLGGYFLRRKY